MKHAMQYNQLNPQQLYEFRTAQLEHAWTKLFCCLLHFLAALYEKVSKRLNTVRQTDEIGQKLGSPSTCLVCVLTDINVYPLYLTLG